ncbi:MAG: DeoR/GlpR transcriptional regulator [Clostridiales bacterium]|nr:DeoR/GlpR transcriptional regulator [Clostridiales bacterium]
MKKTEAGENILLKELQLNGCITLKEATRKFGISEATARRLFTRIESKGLGIRSHGKISLPDSTYNFYRYEASEELYVKEKKQIAEEAVKLIKNGDAIFLDSGTTVCLFSMALAEALRQKNVQNIKVFTNSYMIINILNDLAEVVLIGGTYRPNRKDFCGYMAEKAMKDCHFDKCILGTDGYNVISGFTTTDFESAKICETAIERADNSIILMDSHKYKKAAVICFTKGDNISVVITDSKLPEDGVKAMKQAGINLRIVKK